MGLAPLHLAAREPLTTEGPTQPFHDRPVGGPPGAGGSLGLGPQDLPLRPPGHWCATPGWPDTPQPRRRPDYS
eukprot:13093616-Alexandrium_andersonii.AAC.1